MSDLLARIIGTQSIEISALEEALQIEKVLARHDAAAAREVIDLECQIGELRRQCTWLNFKR